MLATPWFLKVFFIKPVAKDSNPGTLPISRLGMGQLMFWNHLGPKGIFIGIEGLVWGAILPS